MNNLIKHETIYVVAELKSKYTQIHVRIVTSKMFKCNYRVCFFDIFGHETEYDLYTNDLKRAKTYAKQLIAKKEKRFQTHITERDECVCVL